MCVSFKRSRLNRELFIAFGTFLLTYNFLNFPTQATEIWSINEWRINLPIESNQWGKYLPKKMKMQTENQFSELGYQQFLLRAGPVWKIRPWLEVAAYASMVHQEETENLYKEIRLEFEPTFQGEIGDFYWSNRNRLAYRVFLKDSTWRYRNRTKFAYPLGGSGWYVFSSDELFVTPVDGLIQNRYLFGFSQKLSDGYTWSLAWQHRLLKSEPDWLFENGLVFSLTML